MELLTGKAKEEFEDLATERFFRIEEQEATIAGIKKANEILNNKLKTSHLQ